MITHKVIVYTAIFGGKDKLWQPRSKLPNLKYVCFTDDPKLEATQAATRPQWEVVVLPESDTRPVERAKRYKVLAHEHLDCEYSLWIDGSYEVISLSGLFQTTVNENVLRQRRGSKMASLFLRRHPRRSCVYAEGRHCIRHRRDNAQTITTQLDRYRLEHYPQRFGLYMGGLILRRHNDETRAFNTSWYDEISKGSMRDQLSLPVVIWRSVLPVGELPRHVPNLRLHHHLRRR